MSTLSKIMRPTTLDDLVGQDSLVKSIKKQMKSRPPSAWLLHGGSGCGKTTVARIIATSLQCTHQSEFGNPCSDCYNSSSWSIYEINGSESVGVAEVGALIEQARFAPMSPSKHRVYIIDEAHQMSKHAMNALLKPTEDASSSTVWIFCTTEPKKILATLRRRCVEHVLKPLSSANKKALLEEVAKKEKLKDVDIPAFVEQADEHGVSSPGVLLMALEKNASGMSVEESVVEGDASVDTWSICKAVTSGNETALRAALETTTPEHSRWIRSAVLSWLHGGIKKKVPGYTKNIKAIEELTGMAPLEDSLLYHWLCAKLYRITITRNIKKK